MKKQLNTKEAATIVAETAGKVKYQACIFGLDDHGKREVCETRETLAANTADAYKWAREHTPVSDAIVYPLATMEDGESVQRLARYVQHSFQLWQIRNNNAVFQGLENGEADDQVQIASLAIWETLIPGDCSNMYDLYKTAFNSLCKERDKLYRVNEYAYDPQRLPHPFSSTEPKATYPDLCALVASAYSDSQAMTDKQRQVMKMYMNGISPTDISSHTGRNRRNVYQILYKAMYNILERMIDLNRDLSKFETAGISREDVQNTLETFRKRARR